MKINPYPGFEMNVNMFVGELTEAQTNEMVKQRVEGFSLPDDVLVQEVQIDGPDEGQKLNLRILKSKDAPASLPVIMDFHGGGWVMGDSKGDDARNIELMRGTPAIIVGVDYRLSNAEVHFPAPHKDALCAYQWVLDHAKEFGGDPENVALYGTSAGANLVGGLQLKIRDTGLPEPKLCVMNCPALGLGITDSKRYLGLIGDDDAPFNTMAEYIYRPADGTVPSYYAFPSFCPDVSKLGPTMMVVGEYDPLRDEGIQYACRLLSAGVSCELYVAPGVSHGFCGNTQHPFTKHVVKGICGSMRRAFGKEIIEF